MIDARIESVDGWMYLFCIDDAQQRKCPRDGIGELVGVGGLILPAAAARSLDRTATEICERFGFPEGEAFKWSPSKDYWMRDNLRKENRTEFFLTILRAAQEHGAVAQVAMVDPTKPGAHVRAKTPAMYATMLCLERLDNFLRPKRECGVVIAAKPSGGASDEEELLAECLDMLTVGTAFAGLRQIAFNVLTSPFKFSRLLQIADLIVSASTALAAGNVAFAAPLQPEIKTLLRSEGGRVGGIGMKMEPDWCFVNLYHWLWGDDEYRRVSKRLRLPIASRPYSRGADQFPSDEFAFETAKSNPGKLSPASPSSAKVSR